MAGDFGSIYKELEDLDPASGLDKRILKVSSEGLEWVQSPDFGTLYLRPEQFLEIYYFMQLTRELDRTISKWEYVPDRVFGKHLMSTGNEGVAVGAAYALSKDDWITFAIRDLGAFVTRGMNAGKILAQACGRVGGFTNGWDGSLHMSDRSLRLIGLISHLGPMPLVATGLAFAEKYKKQNAAVLAFSGEGATSTGDFHEGQNNASVHDLPLVLVIENNQWGFGTPRKLQYRAPTLALRALGYGFDVEGYLIDGTNVLEVYWKVKEAIERARREHKPTIIETVTMRLAGHSIVDDFKKYVPAAELERWKDKDPLERYKKFLLEQGIVSPEQLEDEDRHVSEEIARAMEYAENSPKPEPTRDIEKEVFVPSPIHQNVLENPPACDRFITYDGAIREAMMEEMDRDGDIFIIGQDIGVKDGAFGLTEGFLKRYDKVEWADWHDKKEPMPRRRVIDSTLAEAGMCGMALGAVHAGLKVIVEFQYADFVTKADTMIKNYTAVQVVRGMGPVPVVFRLPSGWDKNHTALFHSANPESWFAGVPGLKIVAPSTSFDAKGLFKAAMRDGNPVLFLEYRDLYKRAPDSLPEELRMSVPSEDYVVPIGKGRILREGKDLTIVAWGTQVLRVLEAVREVEASGECSIEVIDLRSIAPWDKELVIGSVKKTNRALVSCEAPKTGSFGNTVAAYISENAFQNLDAPVRLLAALDTPAVPFSPVLEKIHLPIASKLVEAIRELLKY